MKADQETCDRIVKHWKPLLGLQEWSIRIVIVGPGSLEGAHGDCETDAETQSALVRINRRHESRLALHDTIIHEMLHCVFWWTEAEGLPSTLEEQAFRKLTPFLAKCSIALLP